MEEIGKGWRPGEEPEQKSPIQKKDRAQGVKVRPDRGRKIIPCGEKKNRADFLRLGLDPAREPVPAADPGKGRKSQEQ